MTQPSGGGSDRQNLLQRPSYFDLLQKHEGLEVPAATYFPTQSPVQYHRRWRA